MQSFMAVPVDVLEHMDYPIGRMDGKELLRIGIRITRESPPTSWPTG